MRYWQKCARRLGVFVFAILLFGGTAINALAESGSDKAEPRARLTLEQDGVTYSFTVLDQAAGTVRLDDMTNPEVLQAVSIPDTFEQGGVNYTVVSMGLSFAFTDSSKYPNINAVTLPDTLETITGSLNRFNRVTELTIPGSVWEFGANFQGCSYLKKLTFAESADGGRETLTISAGSMVDRCSALEEIKLPEQSQVRLTGTSTFSNASALTTVNLPDGLTIAENVGGTFSDCTSLTEIILPQSITRIPSSMFEGCTELTSVQANGQIDYIGSSAFEGCEKLTTIPDLSDVVEMEKWGSQFKNCSALTTSVDLSSLSEIPEGAFQYTLISGVTFSDRLTSIGDNAFCWYDGTELSFPNALESIGECAFCYAYNLTEKLIIPDSVKEVKENAFYGSEIKELEIGSGLKEIKAGAFSSEYKPLKITIDNSEDNIQGAENFPDGAEITYTKPSIGNVGDTISENGPTLQKAVNDAAGGGDPRVVISKHVKLSAPVTIPVGQPIEICTEEGSEYYILADGKTMTTGSLFRVADGANVSFGGNLILSGSKHTGSLVETAGTVALKDSVLLKDGQIGNQTAAGIIKVSGAEARLVIQDQAAVEDNRISNQDQGTVYVTDGASFEMTGGYIRNNQLTKGYSNMYSGVLLTEGSNGRMTGGTISGNKGFQGSAVALVDLSTENGRTIFEMTGGTISDNKHIANTVNGIEASGAVFVVGDADFYLSNEGIISNNTGYQGGGVTVLDHALQLNKEPFVTGFEMTGGTISNNTARMSGGGIYSFSNGVRLSGGNISGNTAGSHGGGIYSEGNTQAYSTLHLENVLIADNLATEHGGGMWFCPTGKCEVYVTNGGLVADNKGENAANDVAFAYAEYANQQSITLADRFLGGGAVQWYKDGGIYMGLPGDVLSSSNPNEPRYPGTEPVSGVKNHAGNLALQAVVDKAAKELAQKAAKLIITGNTATRGGGIGANGGVVIGSQGEYKLQVTKEWGADIPQNAKTEVTVFLKIGEATLDFVKLNEGNHWTAEFTQLPDPESLGGLQYAVAEDPVPSGFIPSYADAVMDSATNTIRIKITNNKVPLGNLTVSKTVTGNEGDTNKDFNFTVTLEDTSIDGTYGDMTFIAGVANFTLKHGGSKTATGLPVDIPYEVIEAEANQDGYATTSIDASGTITENGSTASFLNTKNSTGPDPKTGDLVVSKTVSGDRGDTSKDFRFTVTLGDNSIEGKYGDMTFHDGVAVFTLRHGQSMKAIGLPAGIRYTVAESDNAGYTVTSTGETGSIIADNTAAVAFNNHKSGDGESDKVNVTVKKVWKLDDGGKAADSVTVVLLKDGKENEEVELSDRNDWTYTWTGLSARYTWTVAEVNVPDGFTVMVDQNGMIFTITNDDKPSDPDKPTDPTDPEEPTEPTEPKTPVTQNPPNDVPKTGDETNLALWIALASLSGLAMIPISVLSRRRYKGKHCKHRRS